MTKNAFAQILIHANQRQRKRIADAEAAYLASLVGKRIRTTFSWTKHVEAEFTGTVLAAFKRYKSDFGSASNVTSVDQVAFSLHVQVETSSNEQIVKVGNTFYVTDEFTVLPTKRKS